MAETNNHRRGRSLFISFEGVEGSGKTTQMNMLQARILRLNLPVVSTREPGGTRIGEEIRHILLNPAFKEMHPMTETVLYAADRAQHFYELIKPALEQGKIVLCDRFVDSSLAYQGVARRIGMEGVQNLNEWLIEDMYPDLTILLEIPFKAGMERLAARKRGRDRMEAQPESFHEQVQEAYKTLAKFFSNRFSVINGDDKPENVHQLVWQVVQKYLV
jgi:dTMP kinase